MALHIITSAEPILVNSIVMVIYGQPGTGKTSLALTSESPLLLDFDHGAHRAARRVDTVQIKNWFEVTAITDADLAAYKTVVIDTAGRALDFLTADIIQREPKNGPGGNLSQKGWGALKNQFSSWLKHLNTLGKDIIMIAHMDEQQGGDMPIERLDVQGGSKGEIYKSSDVMGRIKIIDGKNTLLFSPSETAYGKNPAQLPPLIIPHVDRPEYQGFLGQVITQTKDKLNELSDEQREMQRVIEFWKTRVDTASNLEDINLLVKDLQEGDLPKTVKLLIHHRAKNLGLVPDKKNGSYVAKEVA